jgi:hypothetical protein
MNQSLITSDRRVVGIYESKQEAEIAASLIDAKSDDVNQVKIIAPDDMNAGEKLEMPSRALGKGLFKTQVWYWLLSIFVGAFVATMAVYFGPKLTTYNPMFTFIAAISLAIYLGVFFTGIVSLRPENDKINLAVTETMKKGKWSVVANLSSTGAKHEVEALFNLHRAEDTVR